MELRDYARMLRRGWSTVALVVVLFLGVGSLYLLLAPKQYDAGAVLLVSANDPQSVDDLQQGAQFSATAAITYAEIIRSPTVLGPVGAALRPQRDVDELGGMVTAVVRVDTTLIDITVSGNDPDDVATIANATAAGASRIVPALENNNVGRSFVRIQQIRQAVPPSAPVSPNAKRILALALIVGLCVGLAATITVQSLDTRLRRPDEVDQLTDVPVLAVVPASNRAQRNGLAVRDDPAGAVGEIFRTLRTNLRFLETRERRSIVFSSVSDDRERAQVPANLAWSLVQAGWKVLLVDLELRRNLIGDILGVRGGAGVAEVLMGQAELANVTRETAHAKLHVVIAGTAQASPADLLSAPAMTNLLRRVEKSYDYVILHAPPLLAYTDAAVLSDAAGGTILTVSSGRTKAPELTTALGVLSNVRVKPLGIVLTGARRSDRPGRSTAAGMTRLSASTPPRGVAVRPSSTGSGPSVGKGTVAANGSSSSGARPSGRPTADGSDPNPPTLRHHPAVTRPRPSPAPGRTSPPDEPWRRK